MRVRNLALAMVAVVAMSLPARADVLLTYHLSSFNPATPGTFQPPATVIGTGLALGPTIVGPLVFNVGDTKFIQIAIEGNLTPPTSGGVPSQNQLLWDSGNGMGSIGLIINYPLAIVSQPFTTPGVPAGNTNRANANVQTPFAVGHPNTFPNYNLGQTAITGLDLNATLEAAAGVLPQTVIMTFKITATAGGSGNITLTDIAPAITSGQFGLADNTNLDPIIFAAAHNGFPLAIQVNAVPEPSSMCLAGLVFAGLGWRKLRRKAVVAV